LFNQSIVGLLILMFRAIWKYGHSVVAKGRSFLLNAQIPLEGIDDSSSEGKIETLPFLKSQLEKAGILS
jgi:hypothetical protein